METVPQTGNGSPSLTLSHTHSHIFVSVDVPNGYPLVSNSFPFFSCQRLSVRQKSRMKERDREKHQSIGLQLCFVVLVMKTYLICDVSWWWQKKSETPLLNVSRTFRTFSCSNQRERRHILFGNLLRHNEGLSEPGNSGGGGVGGGVMGAILLFMGPFSSPSKVFPFSLFLASILQSSSTHSELSPENH